MNKLRSLPAVQSSDHAYQQIRECYTTRKLAFDLINQLNHLISAVQRHRGISMAVLAGDQFFAAELGRLQQQIEKRIALFKEFCSDRPELMTTRDEQNIRLAWDTIRQDWEDDKLGDNFALHSHFIEQLLALVAQLARELEAPLYDFSASQESGGPSYSRQFKQIELLNFICALLPGLIENLAKIRGLASFAAARGVADYRYDRQLRFFLQCAREQNEKVRQCAQVLNDVLRGQLSSKYVMGELEAKFSHLMDLVTHDVLSGKSIRVSASHIFTVASDIIDRYWASVDDGFDLLGRWTRQDLESWLKLG